MFYLLVLSLQQLHKFKVMLSSTVPSTKHKINKFPGHAPSKDAQMLPLSLIQPVFEEPLCSGL